MTQSIVTAVVVASIVGLGAPARAQQAVAQVQPPSPQVAVELKHSMELLMAEKARQAVNSVTQKHVLEEALLKSAVSGALGPVVTGAPYSAVTTTEQIQPLVDGNRIVHRTVYNVCRDSAGRVRRETVDESGAVTAVMIMDPVAQVTYVLDPAKRTARKTLLLSLGIPINLALGVPIKAAAPVRVTEASTPHKTEHLEVAAKHASGEEPLKESLGSEIIEGVPAEGGRLTTTIPAGTIGNERAIEIVDEHWYSKDLKLTMMTRHTDPRSGETVYRVSNLRRGEVDLALFQVPPDYTLETLAPKVLKESR